MVIGTCGFGSTGSSAVSDYLLEFADLQVLDQIEFTWVSGVDGLIDLDYHLNHPHTRTGDSIYAIHRFRKKMQELRKKYKKKGKIDSEIFEESIEKFLASVIQVKWNWYVGEPKNIFEKYVGISLMRNRFIPLVERKLKRQINCWPMQEVALSVFPENFESAARMHVKEMLIAMGADFSKPIVLDQPFAGNNPQACFKFYENPYAIVVDRDPRDNYVFAKTKLVSTGTTHLMPIDTVEDFVKYYRALRDNQPYKEKHDRILSIKFEDMVYHYDEITKVIRDFLHLPENPNPKSIFNPDDSMANTQLWKRFPQFAKDVEYIERELPEYLFDYTGCPEPDASKKMFKGKSPKHG